MNKQIVICICALCIIPLVIVARMLPTMFKAAPNEKEPLYDNEWIVKPYSGPLVKYRNWGFTKKDYEIKRGER